MKDASNLQCDTQLILDLRSLLDDKDIYRISRNLQRVFFDYLRYQKEGLPVDFNEVLDDFEALFEVMNTLNG